MNGLQRTNSKENIPYEVSRSGKTGSALPVNGRFNHHDVANNKPGPVLVDSSNSATTASANLQERKVVADYELVDKTAAKSHLKLKKLVKAIGIISGNIKDAVSKAVTGKRLAIGMLAGGIAGGISGTLLMAALTGGISMVTLLPAAAGTAPVAVVGALIGGAATCVGLTGYGVIKGIVKSVAYLCRTPEQRFKHQYRQAEKELKSLEEKEAWHGIDSKISYRKGVLKAFINAGAAEYRKLTTVTSAQLTIEGQSDADKRPQLNT